MIYAYKDYLNNQKKAIFQTDFYANPTVKWTSPNYFCKHLKGKTIIRSHKALRETTDISSEFVETINGDISSYVWTPTSSSQFKNITFTVKCAVDYESSGVDCSYQKPCAILNNMIQTFSKIEFNIANINTYCLTYYQKEVFIT